MGKDILDASEVGFRVLEQRRPEGNRSFVEPHRAHRLREAPHLDEAGIVEVALIMLVGDQDAVGRVLEGTGQKQVGERKVILRLLALRDVQHDPADADDLVRRIPVDRDLGLEPSIAAVGRTLAAHELGGAPAGVDRAREILAHLRQIVRVDEFLELPARRAELGRRIAVARDVVGNVSQRPTRCRPGAKQHGRAVLDDVIGVRELGEGRRSRERAAQEVGDDLQKSALGDRPMSFRHAIDENDQALHALRQQGRHHQHRADLGAIQGGTQRADLLLGVHHDAAALHRPPQDRRQHVVGERVAIGIRRRVQRRVMGRGP
jgi:hypothetical protein